MNILPFWGFKIADDRPSLVSQWMENGNLKSYMKDHPNMDVAETVSDKSTDFTRRLTSIGEGNRGRVDLSSHMWGNTRGFEMCMSLLLTP